MPEHGIILMGFNFLLNEKYIAAEFWYSLDEQLGPRWKSIHNVWMENPSKEK